MLDLLDSVCLVSKKCSTSISNMSDTLLKNKKIVFDLVILLKKVKEENLAIFIFFVETVSKI